MADAVKVHAHQIEMIPLDALKGYERNARTHPDDQINSLVAIIRDAGFTNPLLVDDDDVIIAGHGRALAARKLKMAEVPCVRVSGLTPEQTKALRISDNRVALGSAWDADLLKLELSDLQGLGFDLSLTGFTSLELTGIFASREGNTDPDDAPDAPVIPISQAGDLWRLGDHWLICGDCTDKAVVERVLGGRKPHLMVTDQPYGTNYDAGRRGREFLKDGIQRASGNVANDHRADWREAWALFEGDVAYVWHDAANPASTQLAMEAVGFEMRSQIIWRKTQAVVGPPRGHYRWQHEACFYAVRKGKNGHWTGSHKCNTVWDADRPKRIDTGHSTQKPVALFTPPLENNSAPGDRIYDPFVGSGTSIIAAQQLKRICHAVEIDPSHVDRAVLRFAQFSGVAPILADTGETFDQVKARREAERTEVV